MVVYYLAPLNRALDAGTWIEFVLGLVVFAVIIDYETRAIAASDVPHLRLIQAVSTGLPLLLLLFAATYVLIARNDPDSFSELLNRTGALYFTLTVFATVGFGDIAPRSDVDELLTTIQMIKNLGRGRVDREDPARRGRHRETAATETRRRRTTTAVRVGGGGGGGGGEMMIAPASAACPPQTQPNHRPQRRSPPGLDAGGRPPTLVVSRPPGRCPGLSCTGAVGRCG